MLYHQLSGNPDGRPLILLHGFLGSGDDWDAVTEQLAPHFRCLTIDLPGHGRSIGLRAPNDYGMVGTANAVIEVADEVGFDHFDLAGYSMGGRVALYIALIFAMRVDSLALESASPGIPDATQRRARRELDEARAADFETADIGATIERWYTQPLFERLKRNPAAFQDMLRRRMANLPREAALSLRALGTGVQEPLWGELSHHTLPTLLLTGEHDAKFRAIAEAMAQRCPAMRSVVVPHSGHNIHFERPEGYARLLSEFFLSV